MKRGVTISLAVALVAFIFGAVALKMYFSYQEFLGTDLDIPEEGVLLMVESGESLTSVLKKLEAGGSTTLDWRWRILARMQPANVQVGEYRLVAPMNPEAVLQMFDGGYVLQHRFTIVEGWNWNQLLKALKDDEVLVKTIEGNIDASEVEVIAAEFGAPEMEHAEGWFLPETYYFVRGESDIDILDRAHRAMKQALDQAWQIRDTEVPIDTPYELLILASIVEKETSIPEERGEVAGVFTRRLQRNMRLQTDPTVIYGMGRGFDGNIRRRDLRTDTPYNTYTRHGLPPTPIAMPGKQTLLDTARPRSGTTLFFVADGEGGHTFSNTLEEHEAAVRKLIEQQ